MRGFENFWTVCRILIGIEMAHAIRKGQLEGKTAGMMPAEPGGLSRLVSPHLVHATTITATEPWKTYLLIRKALLKIIRMEHKCLGNPRGMEHGAEGFDDVSRDIPPETERPLHQADFALDTKVDLKNPAPPFLQRTHDLGGGAAQDEAADVATNSRSSEFNLATSALAIHGWCVVSNFLSQTQTQALAAECMVMHNAQLLTPARVGANRMATLLRGDSTHWFQPDALSTPQQAFADRIEALRNALNRGLFLGLVDSESHYAVYRPGARYARHLDCLRNNDSRVISAVLYLNEAWQDAEGGALRLYLADQSYHDVFPRAGTLLLFLSAQFEHEVLPATRDRMSIACWMRQRV